MDQRNRILGKRDVRVECVDVTEWGEKIWLRAITSRERDLYEERMLEKRGKKREVSLANSRAKLVVLAACVSETDHSALFNELDAVTLADKFASAMDKLYAKAAELAGIREADQEELVKNSLLAQSDDSGSSCLTDTDEP